jgi:hypothetical protein
VAVTSLRVRLLGTAAKPQPDQEAAMVDFERRTQARLDLVLEEVCRQLSRHGGDHESRKYVAKQLIRAARAGKTGLEDLRAAADNAFADLTTRKSA